MFKLLPFKHLPHIPNLSKISAKIALGVFFLTFFCNFQPSFSFPPVKRNVVHAQTPTDNIEQTQTLDSKALDVVFKLPHDGAISTHFSAFHPGVDIAAPLGTLIHPVADGVVVDEGFNFWGLGLTVTVDHGHGYQSLYAHMGKIYVKKGDQVTTDQYLGEIGLTGNTSGPHTHLQISKDGNNFDPMTVLPPLPNL